MVMIVLGIYSRHAQGPGGKLPIVFFCKMLGVTLRILSGVIEWRRSMDSYLVSWPVWLVVEQGMSA